MQYRKSFFFLIVLLSWANALPLLAENLQLKPSEVPQSAPTTTSPKTPTNPQELETRLVLKLRERRVYVYQGELVKTSFPVAVGKKGWETPTGSFKIFQLVRNPVWQHPWNGKVFPPGPKSPLGERWIGFWTDGTNSIGFHGTPGENLIGQAVSHGCVRMRNKDVKALFELVQVGTPVVVEK